MKIKVASRKLAKQHAEPLSQHSSVYSSLYNEGHLAKNSGLSFNFSKLLYS